MTIAISFLAGALVGLAVWLVVGPTAKLFVFNLLDKLVAKIEGK